MRFIILFIGITIADAIRDSAVDLSNLSNGANTLLLIIFGYAIVLDVIKKW